MACTAEAHNRWSTVSSSAGSNIRACLAGGCTHVRLVARGAGGASDGQGKHRHPIQLDKHQLAEKRAADSRSQENAAGVTLVYRNGKFRFERR